MISSEEVELYDRQIRIWGIEAQKRLRSSSILITGATGLSAEAAKNLALAGIGRIVLAIPENSKKRAQACFFPSSDPELYRAKVAELNPNIKVERATGEISDMIKGVDCVILANNESIETWIRVNEICRRENAKCFCAVQIGFYGFMLVSNTSIFAVGKDRERFNDFQMSLHCFFY
jgi:ubiquitin-like 1-activating enzyme E1 A